MRIASALFLSLACTVLTPADAAGERPTMRTQENRTDLLKKDDPSLQRKQVPTAPQNKMVPEAAPKRGIQAMPAQEVVKYSCPKKLVYYALDLEQSPALHGWHTQTVLPKTPRITLDFREIEGLTSHAWKGASEIVCKYHGDGQNRGDSSYYTKLKRKIHASGTPYRCKTADNYSPDVECRLSITPF